MKLRCKNCGNTERFIGWQPAQGSSSVFVSGNGQYQAAFGDPLNDLIWDEPEGPWTCAECESEDVEED